MSGDAGDDLEATLPAAPAPESTRADLQFVTVDSSFYVLGRELARGGMGRILLARDRRLGRMVAVKENFVTGGNGLRRFEREARITARLEHPSIVSVHEAGVFASGQLFYAMTLVSGRALDQVIAETRTVEERLALLPNVLAVADAMAYAHGESVIHRDLKPGNVLVGSFGQTVVIDWGLAKDLKDPGSMGEGGDPAHPSRPGDAAMTSAGSVMGTPAYMPPEQATGPAVDPRADVYAIGAILDHVLSGAPPFTGGSPLAVLEAVRRGAPQPLAERQPGLPPELLAVVERAMARDPLARYPTARELSEDLRRYLTGQLVGAHRYSAWQLLKRWLRRYRAAVSVAGVALAVLLVLGAVAIQKLVVAEQLAEARRAEAEKLVGFMLVDLRDKLEPLGKVSVLHDVARQAVAYDERKGANLSDVELSWRALTHLNLGDVLVAQGHTAEALQHYQTALAIDEGLVQRLPGDVDRLHALWVCRQRLGETLFKLGDAPGALVQFRATLALEQSVVEANSVTQELRSLSHEWIGDLLLAQGDTSGALVAFRTSLVIREAAAARYPDSLPTVRLRSMSHDKIGDVLLAQGDTAGAMVEFGESLRIRQALAAQDPTNLAWQRDLSVVDDRLGEVLVGQGRRPEALAHFRSSLAIREAAVRKDPMNALWQRDLSLSRTLVGEVLFADGDRQGALAEFREALAIDSRLVAQDPANARGQADLSASHRNLGDVLLAQGTPALALAEFQAAELIDEVLAKKDPSNIAWQSALAGTHAAVGAALLAQGDAAGAVLELRAGLAITARLQEKDPLNTEFKAQAEDLASRLEEATTKPRAR